MCTAAEGANAPPPKSGQPSKQTFRQEKAIGEPKAHTVLSKNDCVATASSGDRDGRIVQVWDTRSETDSERKTRINTPLRAALAEIDAAPVRPAAPGRCWPPKPPGRLPLPMTVARLTELDSQAAALRLVS
ncbi:hypothetical protein [Magnetospirillum molischianum]|uniref:Uncharacterized protein n=1 Tax=Magnetospirillum molischianum DSM 120 TaxID=1150626 RepID=H8FRE1_MAGML|nr:hypothetical protein [Magnetospirillum molischianum]CCG40929.1 hypothetical protein PHAMO_220047 [Magnetospirillum molischianum DSM 120]